MNRLDADRFLEDVDRTSRASRRAHSVTFELTYGCNLRCVHCYNPTHRALPHELSTDEVCRILDELTGLGVLTVTFTGGEPAVRPDVLHILRRARQNGLIIHLLTNATRITASFAEQLREVGVAQITVSMYGGTATTYERMTGVSGSYEAFRLGLHRLLEQDLPVLLRMPVTAVNQAEVRSCRSAAQEMGVRFQYCLDIMPRTDGDLSPLAVRLAPAAKALLDSDLLPARSSGAMAEETCRGEAMFINCACGHSRFAITPYGAMNLCVAFPIPQYDLRNGTVAEGWELLKRTVDEARPSERYDCPTCDVRPYCRQGRSDAWLETGDMSTCLPHFKEWALMERDTHVLLDPRRPG
jgi:radical SAM protein with 4Fe4S-binding SPASM domain